MVCVGLGSRIRVRVMADLMQRYATGKGEGERVNDRVSARLNKADKMAASSHRLIFSPSNAEE